MRTWFLCRLQGTVKSNWFINGLQPFGYLNYSCWKTACGDRLHIYTFNVLALTSMSFAIIFLSQRNNTLTLGRTRGGGGGVDATPLRFFWDFSKRIKHQHLTFSVDVRLSLARILRKVQWWSVSMVTRYDVISSRWSSHFERKCVFSFQLFSTIKVNLVAEIMQSAYLCVIIHVKQLPFLVKFKMATIFDDVTRLQQRHH